MKKSFLIVLVLVLLFMISAQASTLTVQGIPVPPDAEYLDLEKTQVKGYTRFMEELANLPSLQQVDMFTSRPTEKQVWALVDAFPEVRFGMTMTVAGFRCRTDDVIFSMHRRGEPLYKSSAFAQLTLCPDMLAFDLGHNRITDLDFLKATPKLKYLILADNKITDLSPLAELKDLQYLEIFMNQVTDLSPLSELTELVDLNLCYNQVTDLSPLYGLKKLERIWLSKNGLSQEEIQALQEALPQAEINSTVILSTQGGWREHPRFFAMRHTFDRGVFEAFEDIPAKE